MRKPLDSALFWLAMGGALITLGGVLVAASAINLAPGASPDEPWFGLGIACVVLGALAMAWAVIRFFGHQEAGPKPLAQHVRDRIVSAPEFGPVVHGRRFERCQIVGVISLPGSHIEHSTWLLGSFQVIDNPETDRPTGTLTFLNCRFMRCEFNDCTAVGTQAQINSVRQTFGIG